MKKFIKRILQKIKRILQKIKRILQKIFSIKKYQSEGITSRSGKIVKICGIKIYFQNPIKPTYKQFIKEKFPQYNDNYNTIIEKLKEKVKKEKLRVCFLVSETSKWNMQSLYQKMQESKVFEPVVVVTNLQYRVGYQTYSHLLSFYKSCVSNVEIGWDEEKETSVDLDKFEPDIIFFQQPWGLYKNQCVDAVSKFALPCYCHYAISGSHNIMNCHMENFYLKLWKNFIINTDIAQEYKKKISIYK